MGNCCSSAPGPRSPHPQQLPAPRQQRDAPLPPQQPQAVGVGNKVVYPSLTAGDLHVEVCSAKWAAHNDERTPAVVKLSPQLAMVALFDGLGDRGDVIAHYCRAWVHEVFLECQAQKPDDLPAALKATFARLDERVLGSDLIPAQIKANNGAAGVIAVIDLPSRQCVVANVGNAQCLLGRIVGSFNAKLPEGFYLSADHTLRNKGERVRVHKRTLSDPVLEQGAATQVVGGVEMVQGLTQLTRALGFATLKQRKGPNTGTISCIAEVSDHKLTPTDQHLILGSSGFWDLLGPQDAALRSHFYEKHIATEAAKAQAAAAVAGQDGSVPPTPTTRQPNTAEHLVLYGMGKVADRLSRRSKQWRPLTVADMVHIPFARPLPQPPTASSSPGQQEQEPAGEEADGAEQSGEQQEQTVVPFIRSEVHGDLAAVVVSLRWQNLSMDGSMRELLMAAQRSSMAAAAAAGGREDYMRRVVRARWAQVRMLADFHKTYRRTVLRRWWDAVDATYKQGKIAARHVQEMVFKSEQATYRASISTPPRAGSRSSMPALVSGGKASLSPVGRASVPALVGRGGRATTPSPGGRASMPALSPAAKAAKHSPRHE